jgi:hypothetical protein
LGSQKGKRGWEHIPQEPDDKYANGCPAHGTHEFIGPAIKQALQALVERFSRSFGPFCGRYGSIAIQCSNGKESAAEMKKYPITKNRYLPYA